MNSSTDNGLLTGRQPPPHRASLLFTLAVAPLGGLPRYMLTVAVKSQGRRRRACPGRWSAPPA